MDSKRKKASFITIFACYFFFCNLILMLFTCYIYFNGATGILMQSSYDYTNTIMEQAEQNFDKYMKVHRQLLENIAGDERILSADSAYSSNDSIGVANSEVYILESIKNVCKMRSDVLDVLIVMDSGFVVNREARWDLDPDYSFLQAEWYKAGAANKQSDLLDIRFVQTNFYKDFAASSNKQVISISCPIYNYSKETVGTAFYFIFLDDLWTNVLNGYHSQYGDILLVDSNNVIIAHSQRGQEGSVLSPQDSPAKSDSIRDRQMTLRAPSAITNCTVISTIQLDIRSETQKLFRNIILIICLFIFINLVITVSIATKLKHPIQKLVDDTNYFVDNKSAYEGGYKYAELDYIAENFNILLTRIEKLNLEQLETQSILQDAQMDALISKINPHFLFNSLQLIQTENMYGSKEKTNRVILALSNQLRYSLYNRTTIVTVRDEMNMVIEYLGLCLDIYEDNLTVSIQVDHDLMDCPIPKFILHIAVENSIKHGFKGTPEDGHISLNGVAVDDDMVFTISDNGVGISPERLEEIRGNLSIGQHYGVGFRGITQQVSAIYNIDNCLDIQSGDSGTIVTIRIGRTLPEQYGHLGL